MPEGTDALLASVTHVLITHCQKATSITSTVRASAGCERQLPVLCMPGDAAYLRERGLKVQPLNATGSTQALGARITPIPCLHGRGWVGR